MNGGLGALVDRCQLWRGMVQHRDEILALAEFVSAVGPPRNVLEIGVNTGGTLALWRGLAAPGGRVLGIDLPGGPFGTAVDRDALRAMVEGLGGAELLERSSHDPESLGWTRERLAGEPLDFLFIDGDHGYEGARADYEMYAPLLRPGRGHVAFHDVADTPEAAAAGCGVPRLWRELSAGLGRPFAFTIGGARAWGGIGVLRAGW